MDCGVMYVSYIFLSVWGICMYVYVQHACSVQGGHKRALYPPQLE